tara:strand:- start:358 stop:525 length:168 start_codon:yes stop_codon:yes gene_type:complete
MGDMIMNYKEAFNELLNDIDVVFDITGSNHEYEAHDMLREILDKYEKLEQENKDA